MAMDIIHESIVSWLAEELVLGMHCLHFVVGVIALKADVAQPCARRVPAVGREVQRQRGHVDEGGGPR